VCVCKRTGNGNDDNALFFEIFIQTTLSLFSFSGFSFVYLLFVRLLVEELDERKMAVCMRAHTYTQTDTKAVVKKREREGEGEWKGMNDETYENDVGDDNNDDDDNNKHDNNAL